MDLLRTCYEIDMQFDQAGTIIRRVRWYFVPEDTPWFPGPHMFGSNVWMWQSITPAGIGEYWNSKRKQTKGMVPWSITKPVRFCGQLDWYEDGVPTGTADLIRSPSGQSQCCLPDSAGVLRGGTSAPYLAPPNAGGTYRGGSSSPYYDTPNYGGVLTGGLSSPKYIYPVHGGVLRGGTSAPYLLYPASGGVLRGGTSHRSLLRPSAGGVLQGGTSEPRINPLSQGGVVRGGISAPGIRHPAAGGVLRGGTSEPFVGPSGCQPVTIDELSWEASYLYQETGGVFWDAFSVSSTGVVYTRSGGLGLITINTDGDVPCGSWWALTQLYVHNGAEFSIAVLQSYDFSTFVGRYRFPSTSFAYANQYFQFYFDPES
jgi:hypothetical protein